MAMSKFVPWKDPRLAAGVLLVAGGGIAGSFLLAGEATVPMLRAQAEIAEGSTLDESQFVVAQLPASVGDGYVRPGEIPPGTRAAHSIGAGDLLSHTAMGAAQGLVDLSVPLLTDLPASVKVGENINVWRVSQADMNSPAEARMMTDRAILVGLDKPDTLRTNGAQAQIRVEPADVPAILEALGSKDGIVLVGPGGRP
ncbi:hypothetical protein [Trueperella pecoris]|uniref:hypothetical protein n=2 Tax=Trueperella pecoris TaxID=2733571 RepID=UPI00186B7CA8|nr:hypothetical protein [Trueperella pecoris]QOQ39286.1 hypothetical protein HLG82_07415 [Trueperella pecoris]